MKTMLAIAVSLALLGTALATPSAVPRSLTKLVPSDTPIGTSVTATEREAAYFNAPQDFERPQNLNDQIFQCRVQDVVFFTGLIRYARACD
ncbi:MAG: hypothetical protein ACM3W7_01525 [Acidobacteriota bacterium]